VLECCLERMARQCLRMLFHIPRTAPIQSLEVLLRIPPLGVHAEKLVKRAAIQLLGRGVGVDHGLTFTGFSTSAETQSKEVPLTQVLQDLLPPSCCETARPILFPPW
jgi:hypothetical protein